MTAPLTDDAVQPYRDAFPALARYTYLNHAGVSPTSTRVAAAVASWVDDLVQHGVMREERWEEMTERARGRFAELVGGMPDEVAFVRNTSHGLGLVAEGLDWRPGDKVACATSVEYPSNVYPWQHLASKGVGVVEVDAEGGAPTLEGIERALAVDGVRLLAVSSMQYASGAVLDVEAAGALCAARGALLCLDGIQTVGALPTDVRRAGVHFLSADSHKWMLGLNGIGAFYVAKEVVDRLRPVLVGWKSTVGAWDFDRARFDLRADARKLEEGSPAYALIAGLDAALALLLEVSVERIAGRIRGLIAHLAEGLEGLGCDVGPAPALRHHVLTYVPPRGDVADLHAALAEDGFVLSLRRGRVRVAPHFYNTREEMDRVIARTADWLGAR